MRKVFLDCLPKKGKNNYIDWKNTIGCSVEFIYEEMTGKIDIISYDSDSEKLTVKYNNSIFDISKNGLKNACLGVILGNISFNHKFSVGDNVKDDKRDIVVTKCIRKNDGKRSKRFYKYRCNICNWNGEMSESGIIAGQGCPCCSNKTVVEGINDIPTTDPWMVKYFQGGYDEAKLYTKGSNKEIYPICPDCRSIKNEAVVIGSIYRYKGISCVCKDGISYSNKLMYNILNHLGVDFKMEATFKWLSDKKYDFYIPSKDIIIEMNGIQHYERTFERIGKRARTLEEEQFNDEYKKKIALENGISHYIVIDCRRSNLEWIKDGILNSKLSELIDLSNIDWKICEEKSLQNLIKEVCDYKKDNPNKTSKDVSNEFGISRGTAINYMKKGNILGWCEYDAKIESSKSSRKLGKTGRRVEIFKDGESQGVFNSINDLVRSSIDLFGIELERRNIGNVCRGVQKTHKGYTFKYAE